MLTQGTRRASKPAGSWRRLTPKDSGERTTKNAEDTKPTEDSWPQTTPAGRAEQVHPGFGIIWARSACSGGGQTWSCPVPKSIVFVVNSCMQLGRAHSGFLRITNQNSRKKDQRPAERDSQPGRHPRRAHEIVQRPRNHADFGQHPAHGDASCRLQVRNQIMGLE